MRKYRDVRLDTEFTMNDELMFDEEPEAEAEAEEFVEVEE